MSKIRVSVEFAFDKLDDTATRELAKQIVEARGFEVARTDIVKSGAGKVFTPKAGKPGSVIVRDGRAFEVWSQGPDTRFLWVVPKERRDGDAAVYLTATYGSSSARAHHGDGTTCLPRVVVTGHTRAELPCNHVSHSRAAS